MNETLYNMMVTSLFEAHIMHWDKEVHILPILPYQMPLNVFSMLHVVGKEDIISKFER